MRTEVVYFFVNGPSVHRSIRRQRARASPSAAQSWTPADHDDAARLLTLRAPGFSLMTNARHKNQITGIVEYLAGQIPPAATAGNDEFSQPTFNRTTDTWLMGQDLQSIQNEIQQVTRHRTIRIKKKLLQPSRPTRQFGQDVGPWQSNDGLL